MKEQHDTVVIGAGQAGLASSWHLQQRGIEHVVLERGRVGESWRARRWDSFRLQILNRLCELPGYAYAGDDPDGFMRRDDIVAFFEGYARSFEPPVREGVVVTELRRAEDGRWVITTAAGDVLHADNVVVATGAHERAHVPAMARNLDPGIVQVHTDVYKNPAQLPSGAVLVVGGGSSGGQIASELLDDGRPVYLALGSGPWMVRSYRGRDVSGWDEASGFSGQPVESLEGPAARLAPLPMLGVNDTGATLSPRVLHTRGVTVTGRLTGIDGNIVRFGDNLPATLAAGDGFVKALTGRIDAYIAANGVDAPAPAPESGMQSWATITELDLAAADVKSVVWATGYRMDFSWILDCEFDEQGYPVHQGGVTPERGLYFIGLPWLTRRGSGFIRGVGYDAAPLVAHLAAQLQTASSYEQATVSAG